MRDMYVYKYNTLNCKCNHEQNNIYEGFLFSSKSLYFFVMEMKHLQTNSYLFQWDALNFLKALVWLVPESFCQVFLPHFLL